MIKVVKDKLLIFILTTPSNKGSAQTYFDLASHLLSATAKHYFIAA